MSWDTTITELGMRVESALNSENEGTEEQRIEEIARRARAAQRREKILAIVDVTR